jgi:hypothetical protein
MVWYNPTTWFSSTPAVPEEPKDTVAEAPVGGPYGGRKRKSRASRKTRKAKKHSTRRRI